MQIFIFWLLCLLITSYATDLSTSSAPTQVILQQTLPPESQLTAFNLLLKQNNRTLKDIVWGTSLFFQFFKALHINEIA